VIFSALVLISTTLTDQIWTQGCQSISRNDSTAICLTYKRFHVSIHNNPGDVGWFQMGCRAQTLVQDSGTIKECDKLTLRWLKKRVRMIQKVVK